MLRLWVSIARISNARRVAGLSTGFLLMLALALSPIKVQADDTALGCICTFPSIC